MKLLLASMSKMSTACRGFIKGCLMVSNTILMSAVVLYVTALKVSSDTISLMLIRHCEALIPLPFSVLFVGVFGSVILEFYVGKNNT